MWLLFIYNVFTMGYLINSMDGVSVGLFNFFPLVLCFCTELFCIMDRDCEQQRVDRGGCCC